MNSPSSVKSDKTKDWSRSGSPLLRQSPQACEAGVTVLEQPEVSPCPGEALTHQLEAGRGPRGEHHAVLLRAGLEVWQHNLSDVINITEILLPEYIRIYMNESRSGESNFGYISY